ncbi:DUF423 domain-containing protein [Rhodopseudomonas sp. BR0M22]|uniref:DUF423 domain-containing protein n=1 Tax=Rhodopseudomonas sp. BR0M22 TaxID=2269369 RepID=UPI0013DF97CE|nr:DUF423 domain-containing protein [Rhodopseudomonas sp. BR0M22]MCD0417422.1 DUF423 domain-containing protein [Rubrivivax sp. JA1024]NEW92795.1 DUF423 domain-containing protein [Rhodopseudomonas sp. BR0M22]
MTAALRLLIAIAGLYGAAGVALAAAAAHVPDAGRLGPASSMLLFHACAMAAAALLVERGLAHRIPGLAASFGFVFGTALFAGDLSLRQFAGHSLFPMAAPTGGTILIGSWLLLAVAALWPRRGA